MLCLSCLIDEQLRSLFSYRRSTTENNFCKLCQRYIVGQLRNLVAHINFIHLHSGAAWHLAKCWCSSCFIQYREVALLGLTFAVNRIARTATWCSVHHVSGCHWSLSPSLSLSPSPSLASRPVTKFRIWHATSCNPSVADQWHWKMMGHPSHLLMRAISDKGIVPWCQPALQWPPGQGMPCLTRVCTQAFPRCVPASQKEHGHVACNSGLALEEISRVVQTDSPPPCGHLAISWSSGCLEVHWDSDYFRLIWCQWCQWRANTETPKWSASAAMICILLAQTRDGVAAFHHHPAGSPSELLGEANGRGMLPWDIFQPHRMWGFAGKNWQNIAKLVTQQWYFVINFEFDRFWKHIKSNDQLKLYWCDQGQGMTQRMFQHVLSWGNCIILNLYIWFYLQKCLTTLRWR